MAVMVVMTLGGKKEVERARGIMNVVVRSGGNLGETLDGRWMSNVPVKVIVQVACLLPAKKTKV